MTSEQGFTNEGSSPSHYDEAAFAADLAQLGKQALRRRYPREANAHAAMKRRCKTGKFELDPAWETFRAFLRDMGPKPYAEATNDRIDHDNRRYGPGLCKWSSKTEQTINRSNTVWLNFRGERIRLQEFVERIGGKYSTVHGALARGETPEAIASRLEASTAMLTSFRPAWIEDDDRFARWYADYERWRRRVRHDRRRDAHPEVFAAISASRLLFEARRFLSGRGVEEMTVDEHLAAERKWPNAFRARAEGVEWIKHALRSLLEKDRVLTARLAGHNVVWEDVRLFEEWLIPPSDFQSR